MSEPVPQLAPVVSEEFRIKVNDFIEMANRIERRFDTAHAQMVMLHAFSRYGAHHYRATVKSDSADERTAFAGYLGSAVAQLLLQNIGDLAGEAPAATAEAAGEPAAE